eukprot:TRINITY_DN8769_c0_g1_i1.p1 TRINITY_DN8769_c0_g1~~TRINITY_DN8769_c0_g1_i1.p1  ORF type:complete len:723 (-),score=182.65 TRINITY_DN8769_c0_g1_i1:110-2278(-)
MITRSSVSLFLCIYLCCVSAQYTVRRNVKDYGAKGDGVTDDTAAIVTALTEGRSYNPSTLTPAFVYFPPGVYLVTDTLPLVYYTQMVGEYNSPPTIKFRRSDPVDVRVIEAEGPWYHDAPQNNFFHSVRNFVIDMTECAKCTGVHWQVAQATSLTNIYFKMGSGTQNQGIWMENGSGGFISDLVFDGGIYGMWVGNQQFTSRNITIVDSSDAGIYLNWDWGWTFQDLTISNVPVGIQLAGGTGSITLVDSSFYDVPIAVQTVFNAQGPSGVNSVLLDNVNVDGRPETIVVMNSGNPVLTRSGRSNIRSWGQGHIWSQNNNNTIGIIDMSSFAPQRPSSLVGPDGKFVGIPYPTFVNHLDVSTIGIIGDGKTDVTAKLQSALMQYRGQVALYFPYGQYLISDTVYVPTGTHMFGEVWSELVASGNGFNDGNNPKPMFSVGKPGEVGEVTLTNFLFTTIGPKPGAILVEWNARGGSSQELCGMWDVHFRIGGAIGTDINPSNCPSGNGGNAPASSCTGTAMLMHITQTASCYLENVWGWTADHDLDRGSQINVYNGRGLLCESQSGPVWLYGTAMEHNLYYQYNFLNSRNVMMGMIQTETPYFQPSTQTPFSPNYPSDPKFCTGDNRCNMAYALVIENSSEIFNFGAGLYSFFNTWSQACLNTAGGPSCQLNIVKVENSHNVYMYNLNTYGSVYMLTQNEGYSKASQNPNTFCSTSLVNLNFFN